MPKWRMEVADMNLLAILLLLSGGVAAQESDCHDVKEIVLAKLSIPGSGTELRVALPPQRDALLELPLDGKGGVLLAQLKRNGESLSVEILQSAKIDSVEAMGQAKAAAKPVHVASGEMRLNDLFAGGVLRLPLGEGAKGLGLEVRASAGGSDSIAAHEALLGRCPSRCCCTADMICCPTRSCIDCGGEALCCPRQGP